MSDTTQTYPPMIVGNWKMHNASDMLSVLLERAEEFSAVTTVICPTHLHIGALTEQLRDSASYAVGAQDCHAQAKGAFTGDVSAEMLAHMGVKYVIVGHSERREYHGEKDALVRDKAIAAQSAGLIPIICIGESESIYISNDTVAFLEAQLQECMPQSGDFVIAYEPLWAIGTGRTPSIEEIAKVHAALRAMTDKPLLYGGSVKPNNITDILAIQNVNGALVGGASIDADAFCALLKAAQEA